MGGAREPITGIQERVGAPLSCGIRSDQTKARVPTRNKIGTRMAQRRLAESGVNAANTTAATQKNMRSLRTEIIDFSRATLSYIGLHWTQQDQPRFTPSNAATAL
jgi:hypothetical protein